MDIYSALVKTRVCPAESRTVDTVTIDSIITV